MQPVARSHRDHHPRPNAAAPAQQPARSGLARAVGPDAAAPLAVGLALAVGPGAAARLAVGPALVVGRGAGAPAHRPRASSSDLMQVLGFGRAERDPRLDSLPAALLDNRPIQGTALRRNAPASCIV
jgi:hypothetical protein